MSVQEIPASAHHINDILDDKSVVKRLMSRSMPDFFNKCRWFAGKGNVIKNFRLDHKLKLNLDDKTGYILIIEVSYEAGYTESYSVPVIFKNLDLESIPKQAYIASIESQGQQFHMMEATYDDSFRNAIFMHIQNQSIVDSGDGALEFHKGSHLNVIPNSEIQSELLELDQSNTSIIYQGKYFFKLYRRLFRESNPDMELTMFLTERCNFEYSPRYAGSVKWQRGGLPELSIGLMQEKVENHGDAWEFFLKHINDYFTNIDKQKTNVAELERSELLSPKKPEEISESMKHLMGEQVIYDIKKLAKRTAQMHIALFSDKYTMPFAPSPFNAEYTVWLKNRLIYQFDARYNLLQQKIDTLEGLALKYATNFLERKEEIKNHLLGFNELKLNSQRTRIHGDYHLGQVLIGNDDFIIIDYEGEPESTIRDRKVKQTPLKDVAGIFRSFHYAIYATIFDPKNKYTLDQKVLFEAGEKYYECATALFLDVYLATAQSNALDIGYNPEVQYLLKYHMLEKAIYELGYELNARPDWLIIPLTGIFQLLNKEKN